MKRILFVIVFSVFSKGLFAAGDIIVAGGRPAGMGYAAVTGTGLWSVCNNPAGMAFAQGLQAGFFAENRFLIPGLTIGALGIVYSSRPGGFGVYVSRYGNQLYSETRTSAGYARKFGKKFAAGVVFDYLLISQPEEYGNRGVLSFDAGLMYRTDGKWSIGVHIVNPVPVSISSDKSEKLPVIFRAGFSRTFSGTAEVSAEVEKALDGKPVIRLGIEYLVHEVFALRTGFVTQPSTVTAGVGLVFGGLHIDLASSWQPELGYSPQVGLEWRMGKKKSDK
jgi:hypothetical protein